MKVKQVRWNTHGKLLSIASYRASSEIFSTYLTNLSVYSGVQVGSFYSIRDFCSTCCCRTLFCVSSIPTLCLSAYISWSSIVVSFPLTSSTSRSGRAYDIGRVSSTPLLLPLLSVPKFFLRPVGCNFDVFDPARGIIALILLYYWLISFTDLTTSSCTTTTIRT